MTSSPGPVVQRELLIKELTGMRRRRELTEDAAAERLGWSPARLIRVENGLDLPSGPDLEQLIDAYGIDDDDHKRRLFELAEGAAQTGWWEPYESHIDEPAFYTYLQYENGASGIEQFQAVAIPGLLQTESYAAAVTRQVFPAIDAVRLNAIVEVRMRRQDELRERPQIFVIDESAIRRRVGGADVMRDQLEKILGAVRTRRVTVQVLALADGESFGLRGPFGLLTFAEGLDHVLHLERSPGSVTYVRACAETAVHRAAFHLLRRTALNPDASERLIAEVAGSLGA